LLLDLDPKDEDLVDGLKSLLPLEKISLELLRIF
jgi:hypothetical protein